jgi:hypothetical protein
MIKFESDEAAQFKEVKMWVSSKGFFYVSEFDARLNGCTHIKCKGCGEYIEKSRIYCLSCQEKRDEEEYFGYEKEHWNKKDSVYSMKLDAFFYNYGDFKKNLYTYIMPKKERLESSLYERESFRESLFKNKTDNEIFEEYRLVHCEESEPPLLEPGDFFWEVYADRAVPQELFDLADEFNKIAAEGLSFDYRPLRKRVFFDKDKV